MGLGFGLGKGKGECLEHGERQADGAHLQQLGFGALVRVVLAVQPVADDASQLVVRALPELRRRAHAVARLLQWGQVGVQRHHRRLHVQLLLRLRLLE